MILSHGLKHLVSQCNVHRVLECNWLYNECWVNFRIGLWDSAIVVLKSNLAFYFEMKDLSSLWYFLGIEVVSSPKGYLFLQSKYTVDILDHACLIDTKTVDTPLEVNVWYSSFSSNRPLVKPYFITYYCWQLSLSYYYIYKHCLCC